MNRTPGLVLDLDLEQAAGRTSLDPAEWELKNPPIPGFTPRQQAQLEEEQQAGQRAASKQPVPEP